MAQRRAVHPVVICVDTQPASAPEEAAALREERRRKREEFRAQCLAAPRVVIDCGFQGLMKSTEVASLANQIEYCWSTARMSKRPFW